MFSSLGLITKVIYTYIYPQKYTVKYAKQHLITLEGNTKKYIEKVEHASFNH